MSTKKLQILNSIMKQAENADTLDGRHADEFVLASDFAQPDWNAAEGEAGHVLNRTHWSKTTISEILPECSLTAKNKSSIITDRLDLVVDNTYIVNWNGVSYTCVARPVQLDLTTTLLILGNGVVFGMADTGEPFTIAKYPDDQAAQVGFYGAVLHLDDSTSATLSILEEAKEIHKLDEKYLPDNAINVQPDLGQNDESASDYVKNRTHYAEDVFVEFIPETHTVFTASPGSTNWEQKYTGHFTGNVELTKPEYDELFRVIWNGTQYDCEVNGYTKPDGKSGRGIGNTGMFGGVYIYEYPFLIAFFDGDEAAELGYNYIVYVDDNSTEATFSVSKLTEVVHKLDEKYLPDNAINVQPDWNQSDENAADYVKNRTHWSKTTIGEVLPETTVNGESGWASGTGMVSIQYPVSFILGETYTVNWNGVEYQCVAYELAGLPAIGNGSMMGGSDTGEPFLIGADDTECMVFVLDDSTSVTISIMGEIEEIHKLDEKFIPDSVLNKPGKKVSGQTFTINGEDVVADEGAEIFNDYTNNIATGPYSHAEGYTTTASGAGSHAEGDYTTASGISSHAEGENTTASGNMSHAEGFFAIAASNFQHTQGKFNVEDANGVYAHIVGNGTSKSKRSNAHTLDWFGNAWFQGDVYIGSTSGTNKDDGSKKLATEEYVDGLNSTNVKTINGVSPDENGNVVIAASGDGSSVTIPTTLPNPYAITFTGAVEATYDGSAAVSIAIPSGGSGGGAQPDWNAQEGEPGYILNKPFGMMPTTIVAETELTFEFVEDMGMSVAYSECTNPPVAGCDYIIRFGENEYTCTCVDVSGDGKTMMMGNLSVLGGDDTGEPFLISYEGKLVVIPVIEVTTVKFAIHGIQPVAIPPEYVPPAHYLDLVEAGFPIVNMEQKVSAPLPNINWITDALEKGSVKVRFRASFDYWNETMVHESNITIEDVELVANGIITNSTPYQYSIYVFCSNVVVTFVIDTIQGKVFALAKRLYVHDTYINNLIDAKLGVIENGTY